jgi:protein-S-isoprenylcysteine O-methyltransferase Ste14
MGTAGHVAGYLAVATAALWLVMELRQSANHRPEAVDADGGSRPVIRVFSVVGAVGAITVARRTSAEIPSAGAWVGLVLLWCGIGLRLWSFRTLGRYFTFTVQTSADQPVITDGPYRIVRHPGYAGILLAVVGLGLLIGNWWSLLILTIAVTCGLVFRIRVEERALLRDLGDGYRDYAATHKRLVPLIW